MTRSEEYAPDVRLDDLDLMTATTPPTANVAVKRCRRHDWFESIVDANDDIIRVSIAAAQPLPHRKATVCRRCWKVKDPAASRRGRNNKGRGLRIQRQRIEALGGTNLAGNNQNLDGIGLHFGFESKAGKAYFSDRYWRWLIGIPVNADQIPVLIVTDTPGPGHRARSYVVVRFDDWRDLHGE